MAVASTVSAGMPSAPALGMLAADVASEQLAGSLAETSTVCRTEDETGENSSTYNGIARPDVPTAGADPPAPARRTSTDVCKNARTPTEGEGVAVEVGVREPVGVVEGVTEDDGVDVDGGVPAGVPLDDAVPDGVPVSGGEADSEPSWVLLADCIVVEADGDAVAVGTLDGVPAGVVDAAGVGVIAPAVALNTMLSMLTVPPAPDATGLGASFTHRLAALSAPAPNWVVPAVAEPVDR